MRYRILRKINLKKAQVRLIRSLVILAITLIIVLVFQSNLKAQIKENTPKELCKISVQQHARLKLGGFDFSEEIVCPTQQIKIKEDLTKEKEKEIAKKTMADAMADCWEQFGEGKLNLFSGQEVFCAVCSIITFDNPKTNTLSGFTDYFYSTEITSGPGKGKKYSEYVVGVTKGDMFQGENKLAVEKDIMHISQPYAVMFYYPKGRDYIEKFTNTVGVSYPGLLIGGGAMALGAGIIYVGAALSMTGVGATIGIPIAIVGGTISAVSAIIGIYSTPDIDEWAAFTFLLPYKREEALKGCTYLPVKQGDWWEET